MIAPFKQHIVHNTVLTVPVGTPTERLIILALWHLSKHELVCQDIAMDIQPVDGETLFAHIGGSQRAFEIALRSLIKKKIVFTYQRQLPLIYRGYQMISGHMIWRMSIDWMLMAESDRAQREAMTPQELAEERNCLNVYTDDEVKSEPTTTPGIW